MKLLTQIEFIGLMIKRVFSSAIIFSVVYNTIASFSICLLLYNNYSFSTFCYCAFISLLCVIFFEVRPYKILWDKIKLDKPSGLEERLFFPETKNYLS